MNKTELHERYITSVRKLADAFVEVTANWDDEALEDIAPYTAYPFELDLSELTLMVLQWSNAWEKTKTSEILEIGSAAKPNEEWLHQSAIDYILNPKYEYGVWTPWAEVICFDCHNEIHTTTFEKAIAQVLEDHYATTPCDKCGKIIQTMDDIAHEHNLVLALKKVGIDANMAQTGGMENALYVKLTDGYQYMLKHDEEEGKNYFFMSEWDTEGEYLSRSQVEGEKFETIEEAVFYLFTDSRVSAKYVNGWSKHFQAHEIGLMIVDRLKTGTLNGFVSKDTGQWIENPLHDETMRFEVKPLEHYGEEMITIALAPWSPEDEEEEAKPLGHLETLEALKVAFAEHISSFLDNHDITGEYSERFNIGITLGDKTFSIPLCAELSQNFERMIQVEIDDLSAMPFEKAN